jgi:hypothetical protein
VRDAEKAAIVAELERLGAEWRKARSIDTKNKATLAAAFCSGICSGLSLAIQAVQAGGALPLETSEVTK